VQVESLKVDLNTQKLEEAIKEKIDPIQDMIEEGVSLVKEVQQRAELNSSNINIIGMYRMLKDPVTQDKIRFIKRCSLLYRHVNLQGIQSRRWPSFYKIYLALFFPRATLLC
jgi:hypothetical protein